MPYLYIFYKLHNEDYHVYKSVWSYCTFVSLFYMITHPTSIEHLLYIVLLLLFTCNFLYYMYFVYVTCMLYILALVEPS